MKIDLRISLLLAVTFLANFSFAEENPWYQPTPWQQARSELLISQSKSEAGYLQKFSENSPDIAYKNKGKALFRSLILPGSGERYLGKKNLGKAFLISEITLWVGYFSFRTYGRWIKNDARTYAADHSNASINGKPSQFFVNLGLYDDVDQYNDAQQRMRHFDKMYSDPDYSWYWDSDANRRRYERMRIASDRAVNRSVLVLGSILANHLISAIDAVWQTHVYNKNIKKQAESSFRMNFQMDGYSGAFTLNLQKLF
ncbi:MAG: hypothetical protein GXO74_10200 [Calditrichaeota bacterium]|nr:hypothetical protein [Calditrichota bacterium]